MTTNPMDPTNPVTALCIEGMQAEAQGDHVRARELYDQAWQRRTTTIEGAVAAHYVARQQDTVEATHRWNRKALDMALRSDDTTMRGMLPSLHLNLGRSLEDRRLVGLARHHYERAADASSALDDDGYGQMTRGGIAAALERTSDSATS